MTNRRDLLKLFGIGSVVAPMVGGVPGPEAIIVKPPEIELAPEPKIVPAKDLNAFYAGDQLDVTMFMRSRKTGATIRMDCSAFATDWHYNMIDTTTAFNGGDGFRRFAPSSMDVTLRVTGEPKFR